MKLLIGIILVGWKLLKPQKSQVSKQELSRANLALGRLQRENEEFKRLLRQQARVGGVLMDGAHIRDSQINGDLILIDRAMANNCRVEGSLRIMGSYSSVIGNWIGAGLEMNLESAAVE